MHIKNKPEIRPENLAIPSSDPLAAVQDKVRSCIQCGTCTGSCPNAFAMDFSPRKIWRLVLTGQKDLVFNSKTFTLCSVCYYCTLRCPRGLPLTEAMGALKRIASKEDTPAQRQSTLFYKKFMDSVRRHGRVKEMEFMTFYFASMKNPLIPLRFAPLGMKLFTKGKIPLEFPSRGKGQLDAIFKKAAELEAKE